MTWREAIKKHMKDDSLGNFEAVSYTWPKNKDQTGVYEDRFTKILSDARPFLNSELKLDMCFILWTRRYCYFNIIHEGEVLLSHVPRKPEKLKHELVKVRI